MERHGDRRGHARGPALTAAEVIKAATARVEKANPDLNAVVVSLADEARAGQGAQLYFSIVV